MICVDELVEYGWRQGGRKMGASCHMFDDGADLDALHAFAARIGLKRSWFQSGKTLDHYDLVASKRMLAVRLGAREATRTELVAAIRASRIARGLPLIRSVETECEERGEL